MVLVLGGNKFEEGKRGKMNIKNLVYVCVFVDDE